MSKEHGVIIIGRGATDWFPNFTAAMNYAERQHEATGLAALVIDDEWNTVSVLKV